MQEDEQLLAQLRTTLLATRSAAARRGEHQEDAGGMAEAHRRRVAAETELRRRGPRLASFWGIAPATCQDLERCLKLHPDTAVLHYFMAEERVLIFVTTVDGTRTAYVNASRKSLDRDVKRYRELIALQGRGDLTHQIDPAHAGALLRELACRLYELLIEPVKDLVPPEARLCVIPHGALHYLPFGTLCSNSGALLLEERDVFYSVSLSVFDWCHSQGEDRRSDRQTIGGPERNLVAFANPALADRRWDLPMAEEQARSLAGRYPGARLFVGTEAAREAFWREAPGADILALDLHNTFDVMIPLASALRFAAAGEAGGEVTIGEIYRRGRGPLRGRLAVAAVCDGNVGEEVREGAEDELTTLARALHYAGFASVVTSLWRVHDVSVWFLMEAFYEQLLPSRHADAPLAVGEALRRAQLYLSRLSGVEALERSLAQREVAAREDPSGLRAAWLELAAVAWVEAHCGNLGAAKAAYQRARAVFAAAGRDYEEIVAALDHDIFTLGQLGRAREADADYRRPIFAHPYYWGAFVLLGRWSC